MCGIVNIWRTNMDIKIRFDSNEPIYKQIGSFVKEGIASGKLKEGDKLPTVRELAAKLDLAKGTVKHAYDDLLKQGIIDMRQGRGTFIACSTDKQISRKEKAMEILEDALDELQSLGFSAREIDIFFKLKLGERDFEEDMVKVAVIDCNMEALNSIARQIERLVDADVYKILLDDLLKNPYAVDKEVELVVTTKTHLAQVEKCIEDQERLVPAVLTPAPRTIMGLAKLDTNATICVASASYKFFEIVETGCAKLTMDTSALKNVIFGKTGELAEQLKTAEALVVPPDYLTYCNEEESNAIMEFAKSKAVIVYEYQMDEGSVLYLSNKFREIKK